MFDQKEMSDGLDELSGCKMTVGYLPSLNQVSTVSQSGLLDVETSQQVSNSCIHVLP